MFPVDKKEYTTHKKTKNSAMTPRRSTSPRRNSGRMTSLGEMISAAVDAVLLVFRCRREAKTPGDERRRQARQVERDAGDAADPRRSRDVRRLVDQPPYELGAPSLFFELARRFGDEEPLTSQAGIRLQMARGCPPLIDEAWEEATSGANESESRPRPPTEGEENHASSGGELLQPFAAAECHEVVACTKSYAKQLDWERESCQSIDFAKHDEGEDGVNLAEQATSSLSWAIRMINL
jgi:hypothetical protein